MNQPQITLNLKDLLTEANRESDRAAALLYAANIDNRLRTMLENYLIDDPKRVKELMKRGPLSSFGLRIQFSYALGLVTDDERNDLDMIREVRNDFAHEEQGWSFAHSEVIKWCDKLRLPSLMEAAGGLNGFDLTNMRNRYALACLWLSASIQLRATEMLRIRRPIRPNYPFGQPVVRP